MRPVQRRFTRRTAIAGVSGLSRTDHRGDRAVGRDSPDHVRFLIGEPQRTIRTANNAERIVQRRGNRQTAVAARSGRTRPGGSSCKPGTLTLRLVPAQRPSLRIIGSIRCRLSLQLTSWKTVRTADLPHTPSRPIANPDRRKPAKPRTHVFRKFQSLSFCDHFAFCAGNQNSYRLVACQKIGRGSL